MPDVITHPSAQALALFGQGKLSDAQAVTVAAHLETCADCRKAVASLPPGSFEGKVRAAQPRGTIIPPARSAPPPSIAGRPVAPSTPLANVPLEFVNHPKFRIVRELGRGGMGVIYLAEHRVMEKHVALKVISPAVLDNPQALARFHAEAKAAGKLDHQNVARAYDADQAGNLHFLVMEFVEGTDLAKVLEKRGPLPVANACHYVRQAAVGLQHAHEKGMVHRDIKPQNLMLTPQGLVKVLDFGLARLRSERKAAPRVTQLDSFMGTPEYVSPEQANDAREADTRADIYSLGCTLYALLAGRPPFAGTLVNVVMAHIEKEAQPLHELRSEVPPELEAVVAKMLAKDPAQRYQQPIEVAQALVPLIKPGAKPGVSNAASVPPGVASAGTGTRIGGDTSRVKGLGQGEAKWPAKTPAEEEKGSPFGDLMDAPAAAPVRKKAKKELNEAKPAPAVWWKRPVVLAGAVGASLALILMAVVIIKIKVAASPEEIASPGDTGKPIEETFVILEINQPDAEVSVDGRKITITVPGDDKPVRIKVEPGQHKLRISKDGFEVVTREVELKAGKSPPIKVRLEKIAVAPPKGPPVGPGAAEDAAWLKQVASLPAAEQVAAVVAKLKERNPDFDGEVSHKIDRSDVSELAFLTDNVTDISPVRALTELRTLSCHGSGDRSGRLVELSPLKGMSLTGLDCSNSKVSDLSPLKSMPLTNLNCDRTQVSDLSPLKGMPLTALNCRGTTVSDLLPLKGMKLTFLACGGTKVSDLSPLKGMSLTTLWCEGTQVSDLSPLEGMPLKGMTCWGTPVSDLSPLKGMKLTGLLCGYTKVSDLSPLKDMPLTTLWCEGTQVSDLSPLKGMQLTTLICASTKVSDLAPLKGMPLQCLRCDFNAKRDAETLRSITTLQSINGQSAQDFWEEVKAK